VASDLAKQDIGSIGRGHIAKEARTWPEHTWGHTGSMAYVSGRHMRLSILVIFVCKVMGGQVQIDAQQY